MKITLNFKSYKQQLLIIFITVFIVSLTGCDDTSTNTVDKNEIKWKYGTSRTYQVSNSSSKEIVDSVSGTTIYFPNGGNGTITITEISEGPKFIDENFRRFRIDYNGTDDIQIKLLKQSSDINFLYSFYGNQNGSVEIPNQNMNWWAIVPREENDKYVIYDINLDSIQPKTKAIGKMKIQDYTAPSANYFAVYRIPTGTTNYNKLKYFKETIDEVIELWLNNMSDDLRDKCRALINGKLKYGLYLSGVNSYVALNDKGIVPRMYYATIYLRPNMVDNDARNAISHEVGHYLNHVMSGYERYQNVIFEKIPKTWWGSSIDHTFGMYIEGRKYILEDYAFFSEILARGDCDNNVFYTSPGYQVLLNTKPSINDYPSHEGFGVVLLASLLRKDNKIYDFDYSFKIDKKNLTTVPVINVAARDIIDNILSKGPSDIMELLVLVQQFLESRSETDFNRLPAMVEPLGWSYNGTGLIVDANNKPMEKCAVQSICIISKDEEYKTTMSAYTGKDGKFLLNRIYPGCSVLRVFYNYEGGKYKDSVDYNLELDWNNPTNKQINLGNLMINNSDVINVLKKCNKTSGYTNVMVEWSNGKKEMWDPFFSLIYNEPIIWNGMSFIQNYNESESGDWPNTLNLKISGSFDEKTNVLKEYILDYKYELIDKKEGRSSQLITRSFKIKNIPLKFFNTTEVSFELSGTDLSSNFSELKHYQSIYDPAQKKYNELSIKSVDYKSIKKISVSFQKYY